MPVERHLAELRYRLFVSLAAFAAGGVLAWFLAPGLLHDAIARLGLGRTLVFTDPAEAFSALLYIAAVVGLAFASPLILYQIVAFVVPGLRRAERRILFLALPLAALLFLSGAAFSYAYLVPFTWRFLLGFQTPDLTPFITVSSFLSFLLGLVVPVGLVFEWPLAVWALAKVGVVDARLLSRGRRLAYLAVLVVAGALTPPTVISQLLVALPLVVLYELGVWLARRARPAAAERRSAGGRRDATGSDRPSDDD